MIFSQQRRVLLPQQTNAAWFYDCMNVDGFAGVLTDFAATQSLNDLTDNNHDLAQSNASIAPLYRTQTQGSHNTLSVSGTKYMTNSTINYAGALTIMALVECDLSFVTDSGNIVSYGATGGVSLGNGLVSFGKLRLSCNTVANAETTSTYFVNGQFVVVTAVLRAGTPYVVDFYKNGVFIETVNAGTPVMSSDDFCLSALDNAGTDGWLGQIEMVAGWHFDLSATPSIFNQMHNYFLVRGNLN